MSLSSRGNPLYPRFSIEEYKANPEAIKKVNESALEYLETLRIKVEENVKLLKQKEEQVAKLQQISLIDLMQPLFLLLGSVMLGFGINIATQNPHDWFGSMSSVV